MINDYYYYHRLSLEGQEVYKRTYAAIMARADSIDISDVNMFPDEYMNIFQAIIFDNPMFYFIDYRNINFITDSNKVISVQLRYVYSENQCKELDAIINRNTNSIIERAQIKEKSEADKIHAIHDILAQNVIYDHDSFLNQGSNEDIHLAHTLLGVILKRKAVCDGVSKAFKYLLNYIDIRSIVVQGALVENNNISNRKHAWNIVKINNASYHIDVTNDIRESQNYFVCQDYYCLNDELISRDHTDFNGVPECKGVSENYFEANRCAVKNRALIEKIIDSNLKTIPAIVYCRIDFNEPIEELADWTMNSIMQKLVNQQRRAIVTSTVNPNAKTIMFYVK